MNPHVKEYVRYSSNEAAEIDSLERISEFSGKKLEKLVDTKDVFIESSLGYVDHQAQYNGVDCQDVEIAMPEPVNHGSSCQQKVQ